MSFLTINGNPESAVQTFKSLEAFLIGVAVLSAVACGDAGVSNNPKTTDSAVSMGGTQPDTGTGGEASTGGDATGGESPPPPVRDAGPESDALTCITGSIGCECTAGGGCEPGLVCNGDHKCDTPPPVECPVGTRDCPCDKGECASADLSCNVDGFCVPIDCPRGAETCPCTAAGRCGLAEDGSALVCTDDVCARPGCTTGELGCMCDAGECTGGAVCRDDVCRPNDCPAGDTGCPCGAGNTCDAPDDACQSGTCQPEGCTAGTLACACVAGECNGVLECAGNVCIEPRGGDGQPCAAGDRCDPGLACEGGLCRDQTGRLQGPCDADGLCNDGLACRADRCQTCNAGSLGCNCDMDACDPGLECDDDDRCVPDDGIPDPGVARCYTVCKSETYTDRVTGLVRACPADGLAPDCQNGDGRVCREGSCLLPADPVPSCDTDAECPEHQGCMNGQCLSNCVDDDDCVDADSICHLKVCRKSCDLDGGDCPDGYNCSALADGVSGVCLYSVPAVGEPHMQVLGTVTLSTPSLSFSSYDTDRTFQIVNGSNAAQRYTIRKAAHALTSEDATIERREDFDPELRCDLSCDDREAVVRSRCEDAGSPPAVCNQLAADARLQCNPAVSCPLTWLDLFVDGRPAQRAQEIEVQVPANSSATLHAANAGGAPGVRYTGVIEVSHPQMNTARLDLAYTQSATGQWTGRMYYFSQFGAQGLSAWAARPNAPANALQQAGSRDATIDTVGNALMQVWGGFRAQRVSYNDFTAMLTSTRTGSWSFERVARDCRTRYGQSAACYLTDSNQAGFTSYTTNTRQNPIPSGAVELPIAMNLLESDGNVLAGRINSADALHYAGDPAITIPLAGAPGACTRTPTGSCLLLVDPVRSQTPAARINVGGRTEMEDADANCPAGFAREEFPWLPVGFARNTGLSDELGPYRAECRSTQLPFGDLALVARNRHLSSSNPIPDGRPRRRELRIIDGGFINQEQLFLIFEERFESFFGASDTAGFSAYGYMMMSRSGQDLDVETDLGPGQANGIPDVFDGASPPVQVAEIQEDLAPACSADLVELIGGLAPRGGGAIANPNGAVETLVHGVPRTVGGLACLQGLDIAGSDQPCLEPGQSVHYYCEATGTFDGAGGDVVEACPAGSKVTYFVLQLGAPDPAAHRCNTRANGDRGTCQSALNVLVDAGHVAQLDPAFTCRDQNQALCSADRLDLRAGKVFFPPLPEPVAVFRPLNEAVDQAFRYKTRFRGRTGSAVGFAPQICLPDSDQIPYCYDPEAIEEIRTRIDCLLSIWRAPAQFSALSQSNQSLVVETLQEAFAIGPPNHPGNAPRESLRDGFERLYAELLTMMGDESLTRAFASRYDIAGNRAGAFSGTLFEPNGIELSGVVGGEFRNLYEARQYYQEAVTRLFSLAPTLWTSINGDPARNFVTDETVGEYFERVIRASTQKTRTASAIAERYQRVNRPDLARGVLEREYTAAYLESVILSRMLQSIIAQVDDSARDGVRVTMEDAARRYRAALMDMQNAYREIADDVNIFGFAPDYIPFPTIDVRETNGFENMLLRVDPKLRLARDKEEAAIASDRAFETDAAEFQSELVRLRNTYEGQLREICGSFVGPDGVVYPAIKKYATLSPILERFGDPCGLVDNGDIYSAMIAMEQGNIDLQDRLQAIRDVISHIGIANQYMVDMCGVQDMYRLLVRENRGRSINLQDDINDAQLDINLMQSALSLAGQEMGALLTCAGASASALAPGGGAGAALACAAAAHIGVGYAVVHAGLEVGVQIQQRKIFDKQIELLELQEKEAEWPYEQACASSEFEVKRQVADLLVEMKRKQLDALRAQYQISLQRGELQRLYNRGQRLQAESEEVQQLAINVAAARNDPNIRIFRNDAVINAEVAFDAAIREAYRTTLVFEYYTSQSYAHRGDLFLTRLASRGQYNLDNYMNDLNNAFFEFEQEFGLPNLRVQVLSMRDDMLNIARTAPDGRPYTLAERIGMLRETLLNPAMLDRHGYTAVPFSTSLDTVSPATRNHKIRYIEAEINADRAGDAVARLYLTQGGTSVIDSVRDEKLYYRFPELTAVLNPFIGGNKVFDHEVYQNARLRDRPLIATDWRLLINQRDERVNQDLDLGSINDIRLFVYYTDFTEL